MAQGSLLLALEVLKGRACVVPCTRASASRIHYQVRLQFGEGLKLSACQRVALEFLDTQMQSDLSLSP